MFDILNKLKAIRTHVQNGDYLAAARLVHEILGVFLAPPMVGASLPTGSDLDAIEAEWEGVESQLEGARTAPQPMQVDPVGFNPAVWLMLLQTFGPLLAEWIRKRRQEG